MRSKKPLSSLVFLMVVLSLLSALSVETIRVSAVKSPYIAVVPSNVTDTTLTPGKNFTVSIYTDYNGSDVNSWQFTLSYNPHVLHGIAVTNGDLITKDKDSSAVFVPNTFNNTAGKLPLTSAFFRFTPPDPAPLTSGPGILANVTFEVFGTGDSPITLGDETKLVGYTEGGHGESYNIINAATDRDQIQHGYFCNTAEPPIHDVAVFSVTPNETEVISSELVDIAVVVENQGTVVETFDVSLYYDIYSLIGKTTGVTLNGSDSTSLTYTWDTTYVTAATHFFRAVASIVWGETDTEDNTLIPPDTVTVLPQIGAIMFAPDEGNYREPVTFDASDSYSVKGAITSYYWDFGDESTANVTTPIIEHTYKWHGVYGVNLWVTDDTGAKSDAAFHTIQILDPAAYLADLVKWKAKAEKHHWIESKDADGNVTLTALVKNTGTRPIETTITFELLDVKGGSSIWDESVDLRISVPGDEVTVSVLFDPRNDYEWDETKVVMYAHVTCWYDSDNNGEPDAPASTKIARFSIMP